jgi:hypothetical protein
MLSFQMPLVRAPTGAAGCRLRRRRAFAARAAYGPRMRSRVFLLVALLALPAAATLLAPTASASCAGAAVVVLGQTVATEFGPGLGRGGPVCVLRVTVYECSVTTTTDPSRVFTCSSTVLVTA